MNFPVARARQPYFAAVCAFGPDDNAEDEDADEPEPTSVERLFYALGQLYRCWHNGELALHPHNFDVWELARIIGVSRDIEMVTEEPYASAYHFDNAVLAVLPTERFPWVIWGVERWAFYAELEEFAWKLTHD